jgi:CheY-like chemotaxis protein
MTHELRTPISGILGLVDLLLTDSNKMQSDAIKTRQYLTLMKSSSEHLLRIVSDILDFSKIEAGKLHIRSESFNIFSVTDNLLKDFHGQALQKGIAFTFTQSGPQELQLKGDPFRLKQVFYNLLGNALKFTQAGSISVDICVNPIGTKSANVECCIKDTGIGISKEDVKLLFMPFEQADASAARQSQGTGLGLAITHELIDLMKGSIKVESKLGEGSCFSFTIPLEIDTTNTDYCPYNVNTSSKISSVSEFEGFTALVAEDNDINQVVIESLLSQIGIVCRLAENGVETLKLLKADDKGDFNFILMDCQMPIMDGFQATKIIRNSPEFSKVRNIPIIALTANALSGDREKCLSAGMDEYLSKPVTATLMRTALLKVLNQSN